MKLEQSLAAVLAMAAMACSAGFAGQPSPESADSADSATQPADAATAQEADDANDAAANEASFRAWNDYQKSVADSLARSPDPRDWALAAVVQRMDFADRSPASEEKTDGSLKRAYSAREEKRHDLLQRAFDSAQDDRLVQWMAVREGATDDRRLALERLRTHEADNAAVWIEVLVDAAKGHDEPAVGEALVRMAGSTAFDGHLGELIKAVRDVYRRYPVPEQLLAQSQPTATPEDLATINAFAVTAASGSPGFQHLVNACRIDPATGRNSARRNDCATIGRLLMTRSDTLLTNRIGASILRISKSYTDDDMRAARNDDWIYSSYQSLVPTEGDAAAVARIAAYQSDWIESGSEMEAMRRATARAGIAPEPPEDWTDRQGIFSEERFRQDEAALKRAATR